MDSIEQLERLKEETKKSAADLSPSMRIMTNLTLSNGNPPAEAWLDLYWVRKLHMGQFPVATWLCIAPLQISDAARGNFPRVHRTLGYIFFVASMSLCLGLTMLVSTGRVFGHPHWMALLINAAKLGYFIVSLAMALRFARKRDFQRHKQWIGRHLAMGYTVSLQRVMLFVLGPALHARGWLIAEVPTIKEKQEWYNFTSVVSTLLPLLLIEANLWSHRHHVGPFPKKQD